MAADLTQDNTVFNFADSDPSFEVVPLSIRFTATVIDIGEDGGGGGGGSSRPTSGMLYPRGQG